MWCHTRPIRAALAPGLLGAQLSLQGAGSYSNNLELGGRRRQKVDRRDDAAAHRRADRRGPHRPKVARGRRRRRPEGRRGEDAAGLRGRGRLREPGGNSAETRLRSRVLWAGGSPIESVRSDGCRADAREGAGIQIN